MSGARCPKKGSLSSSVPTSGWTIKTNGRLIAGVMVQSRSVTDNFWKLIKSYPSLCVSISTYFLYFRQFPKLSFNKSRDLSRILCLFITTAILTGSECFWWVLNVGNTVILTGLTKSRLWVDHRSEKWTNNRPSKLRRFHSLVPTWMDLTPVGSPWQVTQPKVVQRSPHSAYGV